MITTIYDDEVAATLGGRASIRRASHVEPVLVDGETKWEADMSPMEPGVKLGPFVYRQDALDAEVAWLNERLFGEWI